LPVFEDLLPLLSSFFVSINQMNEVFSESTVTREGVFHWADSKTLVIIYMPVSNTVNIEIFGPVAVDKADEVLSLAEFAPLVLVIDVLNR
jgi:hypothetical protein